MWVMTSFGVLMPSVRPKGTVPEGDYRLIQVRTRRIKDLQILKKEYLPELGEIIEIPFSDYEYRAYCTHAQWAAALARMSMDIDYTKFKPTTEDKYQDRQLHTLYNRIWSVFFDFVSTDAHRERYLFGPQGRKTKSNRWWNTTPSRNRPAGVSRWDHSLSDLTNEFDVTDDDLARMVPDSWDNEVPSVVRSPNGNIDHSHCTHANSKNARRRCRAKNN